MLAAQKIVRSVAALLVGGVMVAPICPGQTGGTQTAPSQPVKKAPAEAPVAAPAAVKEKAVPAQPAKPAAAKETPKQTAPAAKTSAPAAAKETPKPQSPAPAATASKPAAPKPQTPAPAAPVAAPGPKPQAAPQKPAAAPVASKPAATPTPKAVTTPAPATPAAPPQKVPALPVVSKPQPTPASAPQKVPSLPVASKPAPAPTSAPAPAPVVSSKPEGASPKKPAQAISSTPAASHRETAAEETKKSPNRSTRSSVSSDTCQRASTRTACDKAEESPPPPARKSGIASLRSTLALAFKKKNPASLRPARGLAPAPASKLTSRAQKGSLTPGRTAQSLTAMPGVPEAVAQHASAAFARGASFYIYTDQNAAWRGQGSVEGQIRYLKNPENRRASIKAYAYTEGVDVNGQRRRFGSFSTPELSLNSQGTLNVDYSGLRRDNAPDEATTRLSGRTHLHILLYPGGLSTKPSAQGLPAGVISNELTVPIEL